MVIQQHYKKSALLFILIWLGSFTIGWAALEGNEPNELDDFRHLLQKGLELHEIDRELVRIGEKEELMAEQISEIESSLITHAEIVDEKKVQAGKVLRSYYMGQREALYLSLLKMDNLMDAIAALDFIQMIFNYDQAILSSYRNSIQLLQAERNSLLDTQDELAVLKQAFLDQREKQIQLAAEIEEELAAIPVDAAVRTEIEQEMEQMTASWEADGLPLFELYLSSLSSSMQQLDELLTVDGENLSIRGSNILFKITYEQLNDFLRSKDERLNHLTFTFTNGVIIAEGKEGNVHVSLQGQYKVENEPQNMIRFHIEKLTFNGLTLPDSTAAALQEQFALSIYPDQFILKVEATAVRMSEHTMQIHLKATESWLDSIFGGLLP